MKNESDGKVLFNEECSICNFEIKHYIKRSQLQYENCSQKGDKYLKALYVEFPNGSEIKGVDAFIYVWSNTKGYGWLAKLVSLPDHVHMHVLPRWSGDTNFMTSIAETRVLPEEIDVTYRRLQEIIGQILDEKRIGRTEI